MGEGTGPLIEELVDALSVSNSAVSPTLEVLLSHVSASGLVAAQHLNNSDGLMPLHIAAARGNVPICEALLKAGAPVNACTQCKGEMHNGQWGKKNTEGKIEQLDDNDKTALHLAVGLLLAQYEEDEDNVFDASLVRLLLKHGANPNATDCDMSAPIHLAITGGMYEVVQLLAEAKADLSLGCKTFGKGNTALHQATSLRDAQMVQLLAALGGAVDARGRDGWTPLCLAVRSGATEVAQALIAARADVHAASGNGKTPLEIATINNRAPLMEILKAVQVE